MLKESIKSPIFTGGFDDDPFIVLTETKFTINRFAVSVLPPTLCGLET